MEEVVLSNQGSCEWCLCMSMIHNITINRGNRSSFAFLYCLRQDTGRGCCDTQVSHQVCSRISVDDMQATKAARPDTIGLLLKAYLHLPHSHLTKLHLTIASRDSSAYLVSAFASPVYSPVCSGSQARQRRWIQTPGSNLCRTISSSLW